MFKATLARVTFWIFTVCFNYSVDRLGLVVDSWHLEAITTSRDVVMYVLISMQSKEQERISCGKCSYVSVDRQTDMIQNPKKQ